MQRATILRFHADEIRDSQPKRWIRLGSSNSFKTSKKLYTIFLSSYSNCTAMSNFICYLICMAHYVNFIVKLYKEKSTIKTYWVVDNFHNIIQGGRQSKMIYYPEFFVSFKARITDILVFKILHLRKRQAYYSNDSILNFQIHQGNKKEIFTWMSPS